MPKYPKDWKQIATKIKADANHRCEHCKASHNRGRILTVHHLDGDTANNHWTNLVALCQHCHLHIQARWKPGQLWLFDPPEWATKRGHH